ncbi:MAG: RNA pyrophosphohydrolase [Cycloclasticus sp. symbiont of Poecilosclerida sp. N]|nr:MAG: RNA pyrophosphohydrolase [Cycloclasticus sp. symbiont of Poecilosclerida sp. N]
MIDDDGYRQNIGIILCNHENKLFWARRANQSGWQFPQGGMNEGETHEEAMYRELYEEIGLKPKHVEVLCQTRKWAYYDLPKRFIRTGSFPVYKGQKQIWFMLRLVGDEDNISFDTTDTPEFDSWRWADYWEPAFDVVHFKRNVYLSALTEMWSSAFPSITSDIYKK